MLENPGIYFGQSQTDLRLKMVLGCFTCLLNCGIGCCEDGKTATDFSSKEVERRFMRGLSMDNPCTIFREC